MNEKTNEQLQVDANGTARSQKTYTKNWLIAIIAIALILIVVAIAAWLWWPRQAGKPVPAPRGVLRPASATGLPDGGARRAQRPVGGRRSVVPWVT